jgi:hypothetical protein
LQCGKADPDYTILVGDRPGHAFLLMKIKCTWSKPPELAGSASKDYEATSSGEIIGTRVRYRAAGVGTTASGDKYFVSSQGTATRKEGVAGEGEGTWSYTGGTGKLKGIKGKGTYKGKSNPDGSATYEVEGEYQLPK